MRNPADVERPARLGHGEADGNKLRKLAGGPAISLNELNELADAEPLVIYRQFYNRYRERGIVRFNRGLNVRDAHAQLHPQDVEARRIARDFRGFQRRTDVYEGKEGRGKNRRLLEQGFRAGFEERDCNQRGASYQEFPRWTHFVILRRGVERSGSLRRSTRSGLGTAASVPSCKTCFTWFLAAIAAGKLG